jgi:hypothetical protein
MVLMYRSLWRVVILLSLVPTLLLWPSLHLHPALEHRDGPNGVHTHHAVMHADFFPSSADDHSEHHDGKSSPDDAPRSLIQIHLPALSSRSLPPSAPARERVLDVVAVRELLASILFSSQPWVRVRDYTLPAFDFALLPTSPRSPPFRA